MINLSIISVWSGNDYNRCDPVCRSFINVTSKLRLGIITLTVVTALLGGMNAGQASDSDTVTLYVRTGDVVTHVPIDRLKGKDNLQIIDIISNSVESAIDDSDGFTTDQVNQAVIIAGSMAHADSIALRVQTVYAQTKTTGIDVETLVKLDNVFAINEARVDKEAKATDFGVEMVAQDRKISVVSVN